MRPLVRVAQQAIFFGALRWEVAEWPTHHGEFLCQLHDLDEKGVIAWATEVQQ